MYWCELLETLAYDRMNVVAASNAVVCHWLQPVVATLPSLPRLRILKDVAPTADSSFASAEELADEYRLRTPSPIVVAAPVSSGRKRRAESVELLEYESVVSAAPTVASRYAVLC